MGYIWSNSDSWVKLKKCNRTTQENKVRKQVNFDILKYSSYLSLNGEYIFFSSKVQTCKQMDIGYNYTTLWNLPSYVVTWTSSANIEIWRFYGNW